MRNFPKWNQPSKFSDPFQRATVAEIEPSMHESKGHFISKPLPHLTVPTAGPGLLLNQDRDYSEGKQVDCWNIKR